MTIITYTYLLLYSIARQYNLIASKQRQSCKTVIYCVFYMNHFVELLAQKKKFSKDER